MTWTHSITCAVRCAAAAVCFVLVSLGAARAGAQCAGDCDGDGMVAINELILGVNIALGTAATTDCPSFDTDGDGMVAINELIAAVSNALNSCTPVTTPTATATLVRDTPTVGPTPDASCGNGTVDFGQGETCDDGNRAEGPDDSCPANCRISPCERSGSMLTADIVFATNPGDLFLTGLTVFVRYPDGTVDVPGSNNDPAVQAAITSDFFSITPNDSNFALTAVLIDPFLLGVQAGTAITIQFDVCSGASAPSAGAFTCQVISATDTTPMTVTDQVTCNVQLR
jgi:hypothetical protein